MTMQKHMIKKTNTGWDIFAWVAGILVSLIWLFLIPCLRGLMLDGYNGWIVDAFGNRAAITLSISILVTSFIRLLIKKEKWAPFVGVVFLLLLIIFALFCGIASYESEERYLENYNSYDDLISDPNYTTDEYYWVKMVMFGIAVISGFVAFIHKKENVKDVVLRIYPVGDGLILYKIYKDKKTKKMEYEYICTINRNGDGSYCFVSEKLFQENN